MNQEFYPAVQEVVESLDEFIDAHPVMLACWRMVEPERTIIFRVPWINDKGNFALTVVTALKWILPLAHLQRRASFSPPL